MSAEEDVVVEVNLTTGETLTHPWAVRTGLFDNLRFGMAVAQAKGLYVGTHRQAYLTPDGRTLFVATSTESVEGEGSEWQASSAAEDLVMIDTSTWEARIIAVDVWALVPSPNGSLLTAMGAQITWGGSGSTRTTDSPVYLIDTATGELLAEFEGKLNAIATSQFSLDGSYLYIHSYSPASNNIDIVDVASRQLVESVGYRGINLIGEAGLMALHLDND